MPQKYSPQKLSISQKDKEKQAEFSLSSFQKRLRGEVGSRNFDSGLYLGQTQETARKNIVLPLLSTSLTQPFTAVDHFPPDIPENVINPSIRQTWEVSWFYIYKVLPLGVFRSILHSLLQPLEVYFSWFIKTGRVDSSP